MQLRCNSLLRMAEINNLSIANPLQRTFYPETGELNLSSIEAQILGNPNHKLQLLLCVLLRALNHSALRALAISSGCVKPYHGFFKKFCIAYDDNN